MSNILLDTLNKQPLICAEGFLFEMERRGYLTSGEFVPEVALEHPEVLEAAAFAVEEPHYGQEVEACVSLVSGSSCLVEELLEFCVPRLGQFKTPRKIHILKELPKGPSGKIQRLRLAEITRD